MHLDDVLFIELSKLPIFLPIFLIFNVEMHSITIVYHDTLQKMGRNGWEWVDARAGIWMMLGHTSIFGNTYYFRPHFVRAE